MMARVVLALAVVAAVAALKSAPVNDQRLDIVNAIQAETHIKNRASAREDGGNDTVAVAFDPLSPAEIVSLNMEVSGRIYQSCNSMSDSSARWTERMNARSEPNYHCYMVFLSERTWFQAKRSCENAGGYLVTITSEDEMNFIWKKFGNLFTETWKGPWIGLSDAANENDWKWVTGESSVVGQDMVYANWYAAEPDDCCGGQDCASISGGHWGYKWNDNKCHFLLPYICERNF